MTTPGRTTRKPVKSVTGAPYSFVGIIGNPWPREGYHEHECKACQRACYLDDEAHSVHLALPILCYQCLTVLLIRGNDG